MHISAKSDYAVRALLVLATDNSGGPMKGEAVATAQGMPTKFVENILIELKRSGLVRSQRGATGGFLLGRPASEITVADVMRAVDGPLAAVRGESPEAIGYEGSAASLQKVWIATRSSLRNVLEAVTLANIIDGDLPSSIEDLSQQQDEWHRR
jgi:Rrf2 family protein